MHKATILKADECEVLTTEWGALTWFASAKLHSPM